MATAAVVFGAGVTHSWSRSGNTPLLLFGDTGRVIPNWACAKRLLGLGQVQVLRLDRGRVTRDFFIGPVIGDEVIYRLGLAVARVKFKRGLDRSIEALSTDNAPSECVVSVFSGMAVLVKPDGWYTYVNLQARSTVSFHVDAHCAVCTVSGLDDQGCFIQRNFESKWSPLLQVFNGNPVPPQLIGVSWALAHNIRFVPAAGGGFYLGYCFKSLGEFRIVGPWNPRSGQHVTDQLFLDLPLVFRFQLAAPAIFCIYDIVEVERIGPRQYVMLWQSREFREWRAVAFSVPLPVRVQWIWLSVKRVRPQR